MPLQIYGPDNVLRTNVTFSTTSERRFFRGTADQDVVDVQVSFNGSAFSSDPNLIFFTGSEWTAPNPTAEPDGFVLLAGRNELVVRGITITGGFTNPVTATVTLVDDASVGIVAEAPTGISLEQLDNSVRIDVEGVASLGFQGFNFYASVTEGGGASGYSRINIAPVTSGVLTSEATPFQTVTANADVVVDGLGNPLADPLFWNIRLDQENIDGVVLQTDLDQQYLVPDTARQLRMNATLSTVREYSIYSFNHNRLNGPRSTPATIPIGAFTSIPTTQSLFYVVTAIYYDATRDLEYESAYSVEVVGHPLTITTALGAFPLPSRQTIVNQFIGSVYRSNPQVKVEAGSVLRDTVIDPFSNESERLRVVLDFFYRARTPTLLLQVDDPDAVGISVPVADSAYKLAVKSAFYLTSDSDTQALFNSAFDAYAQNFNVFRRNGSYAVGEVTFFTTIRPTQTINIPVGTVVSGGGQNFATTRFASIPFEQVASYFNPVTGRYSVTVTAQAQQIGTAGNIAAGQIRNLQTPISGLSVTNAAAMFGGTAVESNLALTIRATNRLSSVDTGTKRGYMQVAADVPGVISAMVVAAGDPLMQRDLDAQGQHKGGKVDVWIQGINEATVTDTFAFTYEVAQNVQFVIVGNIGSYRFQAVDPNLSPDNPILEMLDIPAAGWEFVNATTGDVFDLTDYSLASYDQIQLSTAYTQPSLTLTDVLLGTYRRRAGTNFVFPRQPVNAVVSVVGTVSGTLPPEAYLLVRPNSPLAYGRSVLAGDYLDITGYTNSAGALVPSGDTLSVTGEQHVLIGTYPEPLDNLGAIYYTIVVTSLDGVTTYNGPLTASPDYTINVGDQTVPVSIQRVPTGNIANGQTVLVSYIHDENFVVTYEINQVITVTQERLDEMKAATADVLAKEGIRVPLDIEATVVLKRGRDRTAVDTALRTNFANFFANRRLDEAVRQSDTINVIEQTDGVSYCIVPVSKQVRQTGSLVLQESISTDGPGETTVVSSLSTNNAVVYLLNQELSAATTNGGGPTGDFRGVFQNEVALNLFGPNQTYTGLGLAPGQAYIIGSDGAILNGISDDATLIAQGYVTATAIQARRLALTANRVMVSLPPGNAPSSYTYAVTYVVGIDKGAKDIDPSAAEYFVQGNLTFTYDEDR